MKKLQLWLRSLLSMRLLGSILVLMALAMLLGALAAARGLASFNAAWECVDALAVLEDQVSVTLGQMQIEELSHVFALDYETGSSAGLEAAAHSVDQVDELLAGLADAGYFTAEGGYQDEDIALFEDFRARLAGHRKSWAALVETYGPGDSNEASAGLADLQAEYADLQVMLSELVSRLESDRLVAAQALPGDSALAMTGVSAALVTLLLLALLGYRAVAQLTLPVADLTNAVVAIGGDQYRPELLSHNAGGPCGHMARALDAFAYAVEQRDAGLKQEIEALREDLAESRHRRLKISRPDLQEEATR